MRNVEAAFQQISGEQGMGAAKLLKPIAGNDVGGSMRRMPTLPPQPPASSAVTERLDRLAQLKDGWSEGEGLAPSDLAIETAKAILGKLALEHPNVPRPRIFATEEAGILAEWSFEHWAVDLSFAADSDVARGAATHLVNRAPRRQTFSSSDTGPLASWLLEMM